MNRRIFYPYDLNSIRDELEGNQYIVSKKDNFFSIGFGLTSRCNQNCPICYYHSPASKCTKNSDISIELLNKIFNSCPKFCNVNFALEGEPFCYKYIFEALDIAKNNSSTISISTNGNILNRLKINKLKNYKFQRFSFSINSGDYNSFYAFSNGNSLDNFKRIVALAVENLDGEIIFTSVIYKQNIKDVILIPKIATSVGVKSIYFMQVRINNLCKKNKILKADKDELLYCLEKLNEESQDLGVDLIFDETFACKYIMDYLKSIQSKRIIINCNKKCTIPWFYTSILSNGHIFPCCGDFQPCSVKDYDFNGIFNHEYLRMLRSKISKNINIKPCQICRNIIC